MKTIMLLRGAYNQFGVYGMLIDEPLGRNMPFAVTYELPWRDNRQNESCIPSGEYVCNPFDHSKRGLVYVLQGVPGRTEIMLHVGNTESDSLGCILVAEAFGDVNGKSGVIFSGNVAGWGMNELRQIIGRNSFKLMIQSGRSGA